MDEERFDEITRSLGDGADRRGFLRRLAALTFGGLTAVVSTRAEASKKPKPKPKPKPTCGHEHKYCDSKYPCCDGFTCYKGRCHGTKPSPPPPPKPTCGHEHKYCDSKYPCCDGFTCYKGRCHGTKPSPPPPPKPTCGHEHKYCDSKHPCCDGFTCYKGRCHGTKPSPPPPPKPGICPKGADACSATPTCGEGCSCATTVEGRTACRQTLADCANKIPCNHSKDCAGGLCVIVDNCCPPPKGYAGICSTTCDDKKYRD